MASQKGEVPIQLDSTRFLIYKHNEISDAEDALGCNLAEATKRLNEYRVIRVLLWAGLKRLDPALSASGRELAIRRCGDLIDLAPGDVGIQKLNYVSDKIMEAINATQFGIDLEALKKKVEAGESPGPGLVQENLPSASSA